MPTDRGSQNANQPWKEGHESMQPPSQSMRPYLCLVCEVSALYDGRITRIQVRLDPI